MQFPLPKRIEEIKTIKYLHECDLCLGFWIFTFLAFIFDVDLLYAVGEIHLPMVGEAIVGGITSFLLHIFSIGWREKFHTVIIE
jgi:hypothetical protein